MYIQLASNSCRNTQNEKLHACELFCFAFYAADANNAQKIPLHYQCYCAVRQLGPRTSYFFDLKPLIEDGDLQVCMYCMHARKRTSGAPRTHFRACNISNFLGAYGRPFVSKLVMTTLCKKWVTSRDELLTSRDNCDTSCDNCDTSRDELDTSRDSCCHIARQHRTTTLRCSDAPLHRATDVINCNVCIACAERHRTGSS